MMEESLIATDIMPAATHLTTAMLSSAHPTVAFENTQVFTLPYGDQEDGMEVALGALDLLNQNYGYDLFGVGKPEKLKGRSDSTGESENVRAASFPLQHNSLDFVIMNPPFTRPTNHDSKHPVPVPSFAGFNTSAEEQRAMSAKLKALRRQGSVIAGNGNAGLASNFLDLAYFKLKPSGTLAMVMPISLINGGAWSAARKLLSECFDNLLFVTIAADKPINSAFSADTKMGELLVVARKREKRKVANDESIVYYLTLRQRPETRVEAIEIARAARTAISSAPNFERLYAGDVYIGSVIRSSLTQGGCASVADLDLAGCALHLVAGSLDLPHHPAPVPLKTTRLETLGRRGLVDRDINGAAGKGQKPRGPFDLVEIQSGEQPTYPILWGHKADQERTLIVREDKAGRIREDMADEANRKFSRASNLHFNRDFSLSSQSLAACWTSRKTLGGRAWPNFTSTCPHHDVTLLLWANTTLGLLLFWWHGNKQHVGRAIISVSRLPSLSVLDTRELSNDQIKLSTDIFSSFAQRRFLPAYRAYEDSSRIDLDKAVLIDLLDLPNTILDPLDLLRRKWCAEPTVHSGRAQRIS